MMRQRIPRWPRLQQDREPQQEPERQQRQQRLHHHHPQHQQRRLHQPQQQQQQPKQRLPPALDDDDDDGHSSDETYLNSRHYVASRPPLPFSFRKRATTPTTTTTPWNGGNIAIRVVNCESSVVDDDTVPTQLRLSDNEESASSDDDYDYDGFTVEGDEDTVYSTITVDTKDHPVEPATEKSSCKKNAPSGRNDGDEGTFPDISDLIVNSCLSTTIGKEILDTYTDARDALHQVIHAFTLGEGEINCVCGRLDDAKTEFFHS